MQTFVLSTASVAAAGVTRWMSTFNQCDDAALKNLLDVRRQKKYLAVVGISTDKMKPSHEVAEVMMHRGFTVIPVRPAPKGSPQQIFGEPIIERIADLDKDLLPQTIINVFRKPQEVEKVVDEVIALGVKPLAIWCQLGVVDEAAKAKAQEHGINVVMDKCIKIEHFRLFPV